MFLATSRKPHHAVGQGRSLVEDYGQVRLRGAVLVFRARGQVDLRCSSGADPLQLPPNNGRGLLGGWVFRGDSRSTAVDEAARVLNSGMATIVCADCCDKLIPLGAGKHLGRV